MKKLIFVGFVFSLFNLSSKNNDNRAKRLLRTNQGNVLKRKSINRKKNLNANQNRKLKDKQNNKKPEAKKHNDFSSQISAASNLTNNILAILLGIINIVILFKEKKN